MLKLRLANVRRNHTGLRVVVGAVVVSTALVATPSALALNANSPGPLSLSISTPGPVVAGVSTPYTVSVTTNTFYTFTIQPR